jgi:hypothetical protein
MPVLASKLCETWMKFYPVVFFLSCPKVHQSLLSSFTQQRFSEAFVPSTVRSSEELMRINKLVWLQYCTVVMLSSVSDQARYYIEPNSKRIRVPKKVSMDVFWPSASGPQSR